MSPLPSQYLCKIQITLPPNKYTLNYVLSVSSGAHQRGCGGVAEGAQGIDH